ncbi:hypothetical protein CRE_17018 [Caenorhabditis remanei]|uniref:Uncharacterized protein n=2 Tax=Caenorhabditis remanei TaxID=31234 RepID=E3N7V7_CAERE|nr:hypothetical protein CRE_17018 [Caenorhabditis remanei]
MLRSFFDIPRCMALGAVITWKLINKMIKDMKKNFKWNNCRENKCPDYRLVGVPHDRQADIKNTVLRRTKD